MRDPFAVGAIAARRATSRAKGALSRLRRRQLTSRHPRVVECIGRVRTERLSYLDEESLWDLARVILDIEQRGLEGALIEAGCALGGSALVLASSKKRERPLLVFDTFEGIPPPSERDGDDVWKRYDVITSGRSVGIGGDLYYGYQQGLIDRVSATFASFGLATETHGVRLIKGLYRDTLRLDSPVAFAHIDCDWYESVLDCLREIEPRLVPGGTLVFDDYDAWSGCRRAVDEFFGTKRGAAYRFVRKARLHVVKTG